MTMQSDTVLDKASALKAAGKPFALVTVVRCESPTSAKPGAKAVVDAAGHIDGWIGGGCAQPAVIDTVKKALRDGQPRLIRVSPVKGGEVEEGIIDFGMTCHSGGTLDIFIDPIVARPALLVIGSAPSAEVLTSLAQRAGFDVTVLSPGASAEQFPDAVQVVDGLDMAALACGTPAFVVVATQGKRDEAALEAALATQVSYIAFIASERKANKLREYLVERGHDAARVAGIVAPAGIEIGAVTYEEIAVSVLAGLVKARRLEGVAAGPAPEEAGGREEKAAAAATAIDPVCGMHVAVAEAEYHSEYRGQAYYFCCAGCQHRFDAAPETYLAAGADA